MIMKNCGNHIIAFTLEINCESHNLITQNLGLKWNLSYLLKLKLVDPSLMSCQRGFTKMDFSAHILGFFYFLFLFISSFIMVNCSCSFFLFFTLCPYKTQEWEWDAREKARNWSEIEKLRGRNERENWQRE